MELMSIAIGPKIANEAVNRQTVPAANVPQTVQSAAHCANGRVHRIDRLMNLCRRLDSLRHVYKMQPDWSAGIQEWKAT
jgi:hypothetical protein